MKIGIYLAYKPYANYNLKSEGLGRYLIKLITFLKQQECEIAVACPLWLENALEELFEENNLSINDVEIITPRADSVLWKLLSRETHKKSGSRRGLKELLFNASFTIVENIISLLVVIKSNFIAIILGILLLAVGIILSPLMIIAGILWLIVKLFSKLIKIDLSSKSGIKQFLEKILSFGGKVTRMYNSIRNTIANTASEKIRLDAVASIIKRIRSMKHPADVWYSPMAFWPEFGSIPGVTVTCFPDITPSLFPVQFTGLNIAKDVDDVRETVKKGKYFIVYSEYQKEQILAANLGIDRNKIISIPLSVNDTMQDINVKAYFGQDFDDSVHLFSRKILETLEVHSLDEVRGYFCTPFNHFSFKNIKYVFYSSQCRANKNMMTLIKAYEYLLRKKEVSFKLIITGNLNHRPELKKYVFDNRLQYDILSLSNVSNQQLAALYSCAEVIVTPTIFEGGFPMTFAEGMSVGTPSVMGAIPQVTDVTEEYDMEDCIFDPFDYKDMAEKILYGVENREKIYKKQLLMYNNFVRETNDNFGKEYINAFKYFIELDKKDKCNH